MEQQANQQHQQWMALLDTPASVQRRSTRLHCHLHRRRAKIEQIRTPRAEQTPRPAHHTSLGGRVATCQATCQQEQKRLEELVGAYLCRHTWCMGLHYKKRTEQRNHLMQRESVAASVVDTCTLAPVYVIAHYGVGRRRVQRLSRHHPVDTFHPSPTPPPIRPQPEYTAAHPADKSSPYPPRHTPSPSYSSSHAYSLVQSRSVDSIRFDSIRFDSILRSVGIIRDAFIGSSESREYVNE